MSLDYVQKKKEFRTETSQVSNFFEKHKLQIYTHFSFFRTSTEQNLKEEVALLRASFYVNSFYLHIVIKIDPVCECVKNEK